MPINWAEILDRPVAFHRVFYKLTGSVNAALMLSQAFYWTKRTRDPEGWFYKTQSDWEKEICLSRREQETSRKALRKLDFWQESLRGVPATLHFRIDLDLFSEALASMAESASREAPFQYGGKRHTSRARPNNRSENTQRETRTLCQWKKPSASMHSWAESEGFSSEDAEEYTAIWYHRRRANSVYHTEAEWLEDWQAFMLACKSNVKRGGKKGNGDRWMNTDQREQKD